MGRVVVVYRRYLTPIFSTMIFSRFYNSRELTRCFILGQFVNIDQQVFFRPLWSLVYDLASQFYRLSETHIKLSEVKLKYAPKQLFHFQWSYCARKIILHFFLIKKLLWMGGIISFNTAVRQIYKNVKMFTIWSPSKAAIQEQNDKNPRCPKSSPVQP